MSDQSAPDPEYRYWKHSWPQIRDAVDAEKMVVIPVGSTEDHGFHLPLDVDQVLPGTICEEAVKQREDTLLFQTIPHGYLPHHMDMVGGITIGWDTFVKYLIDIGISLCHHGFRKLLFVNGHGSNHHLVEQATRQIILQYPEARAAMLSWWQIDELRAAVREVGEGGPEGSGHAGEMETSLYLHIAEEYVDMDQAVEDIYYPDNPIFYTENLAGEKREDATTSVTIQEWWSAMSETGVKGDASLATAEKGEVLLEEAVRGLNNILDAFREYPHKPIEDKHSREVQDSEYGPFRPT